MADIRVLPALVQLTADAEPDIRDRAVHALVNLHLPRATGPTAALVKLGNLINPWSDEYADLVVEPDVPVDASVVDGAPGADERHRGRDSPGHESRLGNPAQ